MSLHKTANKYGLFTETAYIGVGDPYNDKDVMAQSSRFKGLNMKAALRKTGKADNVCFDKFKPLYEQEKYLLTNEEKEAKRAAMVSAKVTDKPFKPTSKTKVSSGLGNYHGTIGPKYPNLGSGTKDQLKKGDPALEPAPRQIQTNPSKKGTYGFRGTTLGERIGAGGAVGEYSYKGDEYDGVRKAENAANAAGREKMQPAPFRPANPPKKGGAGVPGVTMGGKGKGVCGEYEYQELGPAPLEKADDKIEKPFRPSHPPKLGPNGTLNKFPKYMEDPLDLKLAKDKEARRAEMDRLGKVAPFVPPSTTKKGATASVLRMNLK
mmetsp:Transcript_5963/g.15189  ORF Transcript_5963/g.15189 Transcript_5963/m.15189 type:complete len:321 (-) Transcript_5963:304-1266(-)|eukprot:CAMPEP_0197603686 /NCGR_PEP_ID=MMETSP1326-20131121/39687_1 /TAXON_ID=1155430 /ORGANISM="Genus nov. species nov., Strain RCC2288" /LENGTH=320 /DNA_ID=CAMNT_0043171225 /DNA_START=228 /DNA_END=1190 /DNA_ORIENTATION=+